MEAEVQDPVALSVWPPVRVAHHGMCRNKPLVLDCRRERGAGLVSQTTSGDILRDVRIPQGFFLPAVSPCRPSLWLQWALEDNYSINMKQLWPAVLAEIPKSIHHNSPQSSHMLALQPRSVCVPTLDTFTYISSSLRMDSDKYLCHLVPSVPTQGHF